MTPADLARRIEQMDDAEEAFRALITALAERLPVRAARWRSGSSGGGWPDEAEAARLLAAAPETGHLLAVPMGAERGELRILLGAGAPPIRWSELEGAADSLSRVLARQRERSEQVGEREELRRRVEESEALHVLGLAANRTLEPDEVLTLVARSVRSLLGAHYVTVSTHGDRGLRTVSAVGLREPAEDPDPLAERVVAAGRPLVVGEEGAPGIAEMAAHSREGMKAGLGVPLALFGEIFGALVLGYRRPYPLQPRDTRLALTLAGHAAVAISNARLHRALADRSAELEDAIQELRWTAAAKERFFAAMSHELRTPIHSVLGYQSLLLDGMVGELPPRAMEFLASAHRATQALLIVINDVLDLSKLDAGKVDLSLRPCDPIATIGAAIDTVRPLVERKGLEIRTRLPASAAPIVTDPDRMRQILVNLLSNAIKFTERGEIAVELEEVPPVTDSGGGWTLVRVVDSGPGVSPDDRERIFHEFEQVAGPATSTGTGLGLPISRKLARLLGGDVELESGVSKGASFLLRLPSRGGAGGVSIA